MSFVVERDGAFVTLKVTPELRESVDRIAGKHQRPIIGIQASRENSTLTHETVGPIEAVGLGIDRTWGIITQTLSYIGDIISQRQQADQVVEILDRIGDEHHKWLIGLWNRFEFSQEPIVARNGEIVADPLFSFRVEDQQYACFGSLRPSQRICRKLEDFGVQLLEPGQEVGEKP